MDVSHELGALRFVVDSPLSSKVAMFNQQVNQHKQAQLLNPFSNPDGRSSPKPSFSKDEYGKPLAGSLTEMRGQKANMHVLKEMLELCQIIDSEGYNVKDEPTMRVIPFGELFNIYNYISDKVVGILLRARKHKLVEFEGEMLFQRRDDDVPIFLLKPIHEIRREMEDKIESIKRCGSPAPQATSVLLDKKAYGLGVPKGASPRSSVSRTPSPQTSKAGTPTRDIKAKAVEAASATAAAAPVVDAPAAVTTAVVPVAEPTALETPKTETVEANKLENKHSEETAAPVTPAPTVAPTPTEVNTQQSPQPLEIKDEAKPTEIVAVQAAATTVEAAKTDVNNNSSNNKSSSNNDLPTIVIEATAVYERPAKTEESLETKTTTIEDSESNALVSPAPSETAASA